MSTHYVKMEGSEQGRQLLEVLRDHEGDATSDFRLLVQRQDGGWDVTLSIAPHDEQLFGHVLRLCHGRPTMVQ